MAARAFTRAVPLAPSLILTTLALAPGLAPVRVAAQTVRGKVVEGAERQPVQGAYVVLLDSAGTQRNGGLTGPDGDFMLDAPAPGMYTLRADRIGLKSTLSKPLHLAAGETVSYLFETTVQPVSLAGIQVEGKKRCDVDPAEGEATGGVGFVPGQGEADPRPGQPN